MFAGSIADNVRIARPDASDEEVERALRRIGVQERFAAFPDGLATDVQSCGACLSAGERQLISLARIELADPAVVILDEATSSLDLGTEAVVEHALYTLTQNRTLIIITHQLSTAARADRVAVMEGGRLAETGSHEELLARGSSYAALWSSWRGCSRWSRADLWGSEWRRAESCITRSGSWGMLCVGASTGCGWWPWTRSSGRC